MTEPTFTDHDLVAYLDGHLQTDRANALETALAIDPDLSERVAALSLEVGALQTAFDGLLADAPKPDRAPKVSNVGFAPLAQAAAIVLAMFAGAYGYRTLVAPPMNWQAYAATYHALYVTETLAPVHSNPQQVDAQLQRVSTALNTQIKADDLGYPGLDFKRAQILGFKGEPLVQLAFLANEQVPVALCIRPEGEKGDASMTASNFADVPGLSWNSDGYDYLLLAKLAPADLQNMASAFQERF